jgi:hypothetical protein
MYTMLLLFSIKGSSSDKIGILTLQVYPSAFKFIIAPITDMYYFKSIGKAKTYIVLISYV